MLRTRRLCLDMAYVFVVLLCMAGSSTSAMSMDVRDEAALNEAGEDRVWFALRFKPHRAAEALAFFAGKSGRYDFIDTMITHAPANRILEASTQEFYADGEIIDDTMISRVVGMVTEIYRVSLYKRMNFFPINVLNISVGAPKQLINRRRSGEGIVLRAYRYVIEQLDLPIVASAGNDGPRAGLMNPWAQSDGVIAVASADASGTRVSAFSSRPVTYGPLDRYYLYSAQGENTVGALARGETKTDAMLAAEKEIGLPAIVGSDNVQYYSVRSGTSFSAAHVSRMMCFPHQAVQIVSAYASMIADIHYQILPFIRAYIDTGIDKDHPIFNKRLADRRIKYGGLIIDVDVERKRRIFEFFASNGIDVSLKYGHRLAVRFLTAIARPIAGASTAETGLGFISQDAAKSFIRDARYSTLIRLLAEPADDRLEGWLKNASAVGDPLIFSSTEVDAISTYCDQYDLVLALSLKRY